MKRTQGESDPVLSAIFIFFLVLAIIIVFFSVIIALPTNPLSLERSHETIISQAIPQGWGFYSKDPRSESLNIYPLSEENADSINWPNNRIKNAFGINRQGRAQGIELGLIVYNLGEVEWISCEDDIYDCIDRQEDYIEVKNTTNRPTICGEYIISNEKKTPWAYSTYTEKFESRIVKVDVKCSTT